MTSASKGSAIITGGAGGIGCEIARRLKADGFRVVITDIDGEAGARVGDELQVEFVPGDVTSEADMRRVVESAGPVDVLAVLPGMVAGRRFEGSIALHAEHEGITEQEALDRIMSRTRLKRFIEPGEVAAAVSYLASDDAVGVTGIFLDVSGGFE